MNSIHLAAFLLSSFAVLGLNGCGETDNTQETQKEIDISGLQTVPVFNPLTEKVDAYKAPYCCTKTDKTMTDNEWTAANNAFALKLLKSQKGSGIASGFSVQRSFGMLYEGACGDTAKEILKALDLPAADNVSEAGQNIETLMRDGNKDAKLVIDNRVWIDKKYKFSDVYANTLKVRFGAPIVPLDFQNKLKNSVDTINHYISTVTEKQISKIVDSKSIGTPRFLLTNAVYFKDKWQYKFDKSRTKKDTFHADGGDVQVDMMHIDGDFPFYYGNDVEIIGLPYKNAHYTFAVILPQMAYDSDPADGAKALSDMEEKLTPEMLSSFIQNINDGSTAEIELSMPKFRQETTLDLVNVLKSFGLNSVFNPGSADLSAVISDKPVESDLYIYNSIQKSVLEIDEDGTKASSITIISGANSAPEQMNVNRPFLYMIFDNKTETILFLGRKVDFK